VDEPGLSSLARLSYVLLVPPVSIKKRIVPQRTSKMLNPPTIAVEETARDRPAHSDGPSRAVLEERMLARNPIALACYFVLLVASLTPLSLRPWDTVAYVGDSLDAIYFMAWNAHQLVSDPFRLFDANLLHPHRAAALFDTHRLLPSVLAAPLIGITGNPVLAGNLVGAIALLFAALSGRYLARVLGVGPLPAWVAGALYAFHTYQINETPRVNVIFHGFWPLLLAELAAYLQRGERRHAWRLGALMLLQGFADNYNVVYAALLLILVTLVAVAIDGRRVMPLLPGLLPPALVAGLLFLPIVLPYAEAARTYNYAREPPVGIDLEHYVSTPRGNLLYGAIGTQVNLQQRGPHFIGFASLGLAAFAIAALLGRRREEDHDGILPVRLWVPLAAGLAFLFVALSLGRDLTVFGRSIGLGPYRLLHALPVFEYIRIPERLSLVAMLFIALLVARGLALVRKESRLFAGLLAVLVPLEHISVMPVSERVPVGAQVPEVYRWLATQPVKALAEVPIHGEGLVRKESLEEYFSTYHWKPIIHGYVSYPPLLSKILRRAAGDFPSELSLQIFDRVGVDTVVVHRGRPGAASLDDAIASLVAQGRLTRIAHFETESAREEVNGGQDVYRIHPAAPWLAAPLPGGTQLNDPSWHYRAKEGNAGLAATDDPSTAWTVARPLKGDEFWEATFGGKLLKLDSLVLRLDRNSAFPSRFRIAGRNVDGSWEEIAHFDDAHKLQLVDQLLLDPGKASLGFDLGGRVATGVSLLVTEGATSYEGWHLARVEIGAREE
jgi:hypothetical protein